MHGDSTSPWREATAAEEAALAPFALQCHGLGDGQCEQVRSDFLAAGIDALRQLTVRLQRPPTQSEADKVRAALASHFNVHILPPMRAHASGSIH